MDNGKRRRKIIGVSLSIFHYLLSINSRSWLLLVLGLAAALLLWINFLAFPIVEPPSLDASWARVLAYHLLHRSRAGVDYVYGYGPLGFFLTGVYVPALFVPKLLWEAVVKLFLVAAICRLGLSLSIGARVVAFFYVFCMLSGAIDPEEQYMLGLVAFGVLPRLPGRVGRFVELLGLAMVAVLGLVKGPFLFLGMAVWFAILIRTRERWWRGVILATYPVVYLLVWVLMGQSPGDLPAFFSGLFEFTRGFGDAMAVEGDSYQLLVALVLLGILAATLASIPRTRLFSREGLSGLVVVATATFVVWKHGFARQDPPHVAKFFILMPLFPLIVLAMFDQVRRVNRRVALALGALLVPMILPRFPVDVTPSNCLDRFMGNSAHLLYLDDYRKRLDIEHGVRQYQCRLPRLSALVGNDPVDTLTFGQSWVLLNDWNYRPRPMFQSCTAYTPWLAERNAAFFRGPDAPRFLLWGFVAIDGRYPSLEDGPAALEIFRRYTPVAEEKGFLLLRRREDEPTGPDSPVLVAEHELRIGDSLSLTRYPTPLVAEIDVSETFLDRVRSFLFRPPPCSLRVWFGEKEETFKFVPAMGRTRFLLSPSFRVRSDVWLDRPASVRVVTAIAVERDRMTQGFREVHVRLYRLSAPP
jgi:hypothetical protein